MDERTQFLLQAIANHLRAGRHLDGSFLAEHDVAFEELGVFTVVADLIEGVIRLPMEYQLLLRTAGGPAPFMTPKLTLHAMARLLYNTMMTDAGEELSRVLNSQSTTPPNQPA